ncbi:MAG: hypothetical protein A3G75_09405 [Verrucomicrobia bacterium RIFCSPLOWO2_12_FULL_64_8]|nr:MAG: hypothetical protein A3G75_09405 [Verrucomicrobia bacterium RIFCSPLOWO2_12_FULL_64_8]
MSSILQLVATRPVRKFAAGEVVMQQGDRTGRMLVLIDGEVEILRDNVQVAKAATPGGVFGEMSVLMDCPHTATVRALRPSSFAVIENPLEFLLATPEASLHVATLLAQRLDSLSQFVSIVKRQY